MTRLWHHSAKKVVIVNHVPTRLRARLYQPLVTSLLQTSKWHGFKVCTTWKQPWHRVNRMIVTSSYWGWYGPAWQPCGPCYMVGVSVWEVTPPYTHTTQLTNQIIRWNELHTYIPVTPSTRHTSSEDEVLTLLLVQMALADLRYPSSGTITPASPWMGSAMKAQTFRSAQATCSVHGSRQ